MILQHSLRVLFSLIVAACLASSAAEAASPKARAMARTLSAPPAAALRGKHFTVHQILRRHDIRRHLRGVDIDTINFRFASAQIDPQEQDKLSDIAGALHILLRRNPYERFIIEGHTDAVGSAAANQRLSTYRARNALDILAYTYSVPRYAMTPAGYGESLLKIPVPYAERRNRRVTVRRITDVLSLTPLHRRSRTLYRTTPR